MTQATYRIEPGGEYGWVVNHDGSPEGDYATKEAAFEAAVGAASRAIHNGEAVTITVDGSGADEANLGRS